MHSIFFVTKGRPYDRESGDQNTITTLNPHSPPITPSKDNSKIKIEKITKNKEQKAHCTICFFVLLRWEGVTVGSTRIKIITNCYLGKA